MSKETKYIGKRDLVYRQKRPTDTYKMEQAKSFNASLDRQRAKADVQLKLEAVRRRETGGKIL